jgi:hypothetical protein
MRKDRLDWVLSGIDREKLNKFDREFLQRILKKQAEDLTRPEENHLEQIYRGKSR